MVEPSTILDVLTTITTVQSEAPAMGSLEFLDRKMTYGKLLELLYKTNSKLRNLGIGRGDCLALVAPSNDLTTATVSLAIAGSATCAVLNPDYTEFEFTHYFSRLAPKALVVFPEIGTAAMTAAEKLGIPIIRVKLEEDSVSGWFTLQGCTQLPAQALDFAGVDDNAFIFLTSGSTAQPKLVPITHRGLWFSCINTARALALSPQDSCLNVLPLFHVHGLITNVLLPLMTGSQVIFSGGFEAECFLSWLEMSQATWYSVGPSIHQMIMDAATPTSLQGKSFALRFIRSGSAKLHPQLANRLETLLGVPMLEAYGMSEVLTVTNTLLPPRLRKPGSVGPSIGSTLAVMNELGQLLPPDTMGEIVVGGPSVTPGYLDDAEANSAAFINGWFRTGDLGWLDSDGYLFISGRIKELINRGGEKISPKEVDQVLLDIGAVQSAITYGIPHPVLGEDVAAAVVLKPGMETTPQTIRSSLLQRLAHFKVPRQVLFVDALPLTPSGKVDRLALVKLTTSEFLEKSPYVAPRTPLEQQLADIWAEVLKLERVGIHDNFFELGGHSLLATQVVTRIHTRCQMELPLRHLFEAPTIHEIALSILQQQLDGLNEADLAQIFAELNQ